MTVQTFTPTDTTGYTWGTFTDEGMLAGQMSYAAARAEADAADAEDGVIVDRECQDHEEQRATACEECADDDDAAEDLEAAREALDAYAVQIAAAHEEAAHLRAQLADARRDADAQERRADALRVELGVTDRELTQTREELADAKDVTARYQRQVAFYARDLATRATDLAALAVE